MTEAVTTITGELFTHKLLWECCKRQHEAALRARRESTGPIYFEMSAMLMAYLTYEAYLNFIGDRLAPEIWQKEREFFNQAPYLGIEGKLRRLCEIFGAKVEKGKRPYQTIIELNKLRTYLAHGKPDKYELTMEHPRDRRPKLFRSRFRTLVTRQKADRAIKDVQDFIVFLHQHLASLIDDQWAKDDPLEGISEHASGDTRSKT